jgi:hypothetical protein
VGERERVCVRVIVRARVIDSDGDTVPEGVLLWVNEGLCDCEADVLMLGVCEAVAV